MIIDLQGIIVIVGNYGSGKTEIAVNLAVQRKRDGLDVCLADLDLVNPYFRSREARHILKSRGIDVILPPEAYLQADLPILSPEIAGLLRRPRQVTIIDVGGDDAGATVLSALNDAFKGRVYQMLQVINPMRPNTDTIEGCLGIKAQIEAASRLTINGIIGNANLIDETTVNDIDRGYDFVLNVSQRSGLPLRFIAVTRKLLPQVDTGAFVCPVLTIERQLVPPWLKAGQF